VRREYSCASPCRQHREEEEVKAVAVSPFSRLSRGGVAQRRTGRRAWKRYPWYTFYLFLAPWLVIGFLLLTVVPMAVNLLVSFMSWDGQWGTHVHFVGLDNYTTALSDPDMLHSRRQTLIYTAITVSAGVAGSLGLAVFLNQPRRGVTIFRTLYYWYRSWQQAPHSSCYSTVQMAWSIASRCSLAAARSNG
jgi:hypothetical protein